MDERTKLLAGILIFVVALSGGVTGWTKYVSGPIKKKNTELAQVKDEIKSLEETRTEIQRKQKKLQRWRETSLPPDEVNSQRLYKNWLTDLAKIAGFSQSPMPKVTLGSVKTVRIGRRRKRILFHSVPITFKGTVSFANLNRFLYYFHRTKLVHRITELRISNKEPEHDLKLVVEFKAEALSLKGIKSRDRLFPSTRLIADFNTAQKSIHVETAGISKRFPTRGAFHVRIGKQLLTVTKRNGPNWSITPGLEESDESRTAESELAAKVAATEAAPLNYGKGFPVELTPLRTANKHNLAYYKQTLFGPGRSPFMLPQVFSPEFSGLTDKTLLRGETLEMQVTAHGIDPRKGSLRYVLTSDLKSLKMDAKNGSLQWKPANTAAADKYAAQVLVYQGTAKQPILKGDFSITLKEVNRQPVLSDVKDRSVLIGKTVTFQVQATDADLPNDQLAFSLKEAPAGAKIDPATGTFTWTPSEATEPKEYSLEVVVTDNGKPAQSRSQVVTITVLEDKRRFTYFIGVVSENGEREAWLYDVSTRKETKLKEGSSFEIAGVSGFVFVIGRDFLEFQSNGITYRLALGKTLRDPERLTAPEKPAVQKDVGDKKTIR